METSTLAVLQKKKMENIYARSPSEEDEDIARTEEGAVL